jgi:aminoglycoside phosphotransferase (APT) family kinase protein
MNDSDEVELDAITSLLKATIGEQVKVVGYQVANYQQDYRVLLARLRHPNLKVVIKLAGPAAQMASQFERTAAIYRLVRQSTTIPMPEVIACDTTFQAWPWRYLILTYLPGTEWRLLRRRLPEAEKALAYREIGAAVGQLHSIEFPDFGLIDGNGQVSQSDPSGLAALRKHAARIIPTPRLQEAFLAALEQHSTCFEQMPGAGLCHEDLHHSNILFTKRAEQWRLAAILDFDKAWAGPTESDLARLEIWRGMTSPDFWDSYRALRTVDDGYLQRRPIYQLLWCLEFARSTPDHLADTRRVCQELGRPVIESFD